MAMMKNPSAKAATSQKASFPVSFGQFRVKVQKRAKAIFLKRQELKTPGDALSDWLLAEKEIKAKYHIV